MKLIRKALYILSIASLAGCSEDTVVIDPAASDNLEYYLAQSKAPISEGKFDFFIGNHSSFEEEVDNRPVMLLFNAPDSAFDYRIYMTDSLRYPDSLGAFIQVLSNQEPEEDLVFRRYRQRTLTRDRYVRASFRVGDSIRISEPTALRAATLNTTDLQGLSIDETEDDLRFSWTDVIATDQYLVSIKDSYGDYVSSILTFRTSFSFYDLRFTSRNLKPNTQNAQLSGGQRYEIEVIAISRRGWMNALGTKSFSLDYDH